MIGIVLAIFVAVIWSLGEVSYSKVSKREDQANVYLYTYLFRSLIYLGVVFLFRRSLFGTFQAGRMSSMLPIIFCDLFASLVINVAVYNGKLSVVSPIMAAYPVLDIFLGVLLLKEKTNLFEILLVLIISISIIILAIHPKKSDKAPNPKKGILFSILYLLLVALSTYFEKSIYIKNYTVYDLYYYKGMIYSFTTVFFVFNILITKRKFQKPNLEFAKGCGLTPIGNVLYSFALSHSNMMIVSPISSLYSVMTNYISRHYLKEKETIKEKICIGLLLLSTFLLILEKVR